jgi:hypothetical protein
MIITTWKRLKHGNFRFVQHSSEGIQASETTKGEESTKRLSQKMYATPISQKNLNNF